MAFLNPVPGQEYSVKYVNMVTGCCISLLHRRTFQGRQPGGVQCHEMCALCTEADPKDIQSGRTGIPAGGAEGMSLQCDRRQGGKAASAFFYDRDDLRAGYSLSRSGE